MRKTVCLIGRPNTGKSTLFNRLINEKKSIIDDAPGVTRDRIYGIVNYGNKSFQLIDTGGIDLAKEDFNHNIKMQAELAIDESDVIVFVIDGKTDLTSNDLLISENLKRTKKKDSLNDEIILLTYDKSTRKVSSILKDSSLISDN